MTEFYNNRYVIKVESGHPGYSHYQIISTREGMAEMVRSLQAALESPEGERRSGSLWNDSATIAHGQTSRVYLSFKLADDLSIYHVRPSRFKEGISFLGCICVALALLTLAYIGATAVVSGRWP